MIRALRHGDRRLDGALLESSIERARRSATTGLVPIRSADPLEAVVDALAVRLAGGVPLLGDDRWSDAHWAGLTRRLAGAPMPEGAAWATFTSGSTGSPRILLRTERSWRSSFDALGDALRLGDDETVHLPVSLLSSMTVSSIVHAAAIGAAVVLPRRHGVVAADLGTATWAHVTPLGLEAIVAALDAGAPSRLRAVQVGGAPLGPELRARAESHGLRVIAYYGAAELSYVALDDDGRGLRPFDGVELRATGGRLEVRSPYLALEARDADGRATWRPDAEGWGAAADAVELGADARGPLLRVRGRRDSAFLSAGATVLPEDVEAAFAGMPGIRAAVALGLDEPRVGALVVLVVEPDPAVALDADALRRRARSRLPRSHWPRRWFVAAPLPRTAGGKPARAEIARLAAAGALAPCPRAGAAAGSTVTEEAR